MAAARSAGLVVSTSGENAASAPAGRKRASNPGRSPTLAPTYIFWVSTRTSWRPRSPSLSSAARTGADPHARTEANVASTARAVFVPGTALQANRQNRPILLVSRSRALTCHLHMVNLPLLQRVPASPGCCARAASGHVAAAPAPTRVMNSRRLMGLTPKAKDRGLTIAGLERVGGVRRNKKRRPISASGQKLLLQ